MRIGNWSTFETRGRSLQFVHTFVVLSHHTFNWSIVSRVVPSIYSPSYLRLIHPLNWTVRPATLHSLTLQRTGLWLKQFWKISWKLLPNGESFLLFSVICSVVLVFSWFFHVFNKCAVVRPWRSPVSDCLSMAPTRNWTLPANRLKLKPVYLLPKQNRCGQSWQVT